MDAAIHASRRANLSDEDFARFDHFTLRDGLDFFEGVLAVDVADFAPLSPHAIASVVDLFNVIAFGSLKNRLSLDAASNNG